MYSMFICKKKWIYSNYTFVNDHNKFKNIRDKTGELCKRAKSLYVVNDQRRYVFFCVPKVGSRSIFEVLGLKSPSNHHINLPGEIREEEAYYSNFPNNKPKRLDYFKFGFVRNPFDRLVSTYKDKVLKCNNTEWELPYYKKFHGKNFKYFVDYIYANYDIKNMERHLRTQISLLNNLSDIDFIGKYENFDSDVRFVMEKLSLVKKTIPHLNSSSPYSLIYKSYYDNTTIRKVEQIYWEDLQFFEYKF